MRYIYLGVLFCLVFLSCDNTLDLNADWEDIPIVYGLLSATEDVQYIRVEKAFLDPVKSGLEVALISDSIYYQSLDVSLVNTSTNEAFRLEEVDGADYGLPRGEGAFATIPNILYRIDSEDLVIKPGESYELQINRGESKPLVTAFATVIDTVLISQPGARINFTYSSNFRIQWFPKTTGNDPKIYDAGMVIRYDEEQANVPDSPVESKSIFWLIDKEISDTELLTSGREFYVFLSNNLEADPNILRTFRGMDVVIDAGGPEILDYTRVGQANLGITASQEIPFYTNISEGRGIFSSRNRKVKTGILLSPVAKDSLVNGVFTKQLNFKN